MNKNEEEKVYKELKARLIKYFDEVENDEEIDEDNETENIISLTDEAGVETDFEFLDLISYEHEEFVVLLPVEDSDEPGEVVILKLVSSEDDKVEEYVGVDDDQILEAVFEIFKAKFADKFNFID